VVQHEVDHLDGVLYLDRMDDLQLLVCTEEMHHLNAALAAATRDTDAPSRT
jgi:peptide deformylase